MYLYTLDEEFLPKDIIDQFTSLIWTERYSASGDFSLVLDPTPELIEKLAKSTFVSLPGSKEIMIVDTHSIENGLLTINGMSLLSVLENRPFRMDSDPTITAWNPLVGSDPDTDTPGGLIGQIITNSVITPYASSGLDHVHEDISNLSLGTMDSSGDEIIISVPYGTVWEAISPIAEAYGLGLSLYLDSASGSGYSLKFTAYKGRDLTSAQTTYPVVRFSPSLDNLIDVKELTSIKGYKNVAYVFRTTFVNAPDPGWDLDGGPIIVYVPGFDPDTMGFNRRSMMVMDGSIDSDQLANMDQTQHDALLAQRGADALANNNYISIVDGQIPPQSGYEFGSDYKLGDIVELQGLGGNNQSARITEYIRVQDGEGERAYPTISVIE